MQSPAPVNPRYRRCDDPDAVGDIELLDRIVARDPRAIADLFDRHHRLLFRVILRIVRNRSDAEDVLQDVFLRVWTRARTYDSTLGPPIAWLVAIAQHRGIDRVRAAARRPIADIHDLPAPPPSCPETCAVATQRQRAVTVALGSLSREQRALIEEAFYQGRTHTELAVRWGMPLGTVKSRIRTGLMRMRLAFTRPDARLTA